MKRHTYQKIDDAEFDLHQMHKEYLRSRGWQDNGHYPGGLVLWHHAADGYKGCNLHLAYSLQSNKEKLSGE